MQDIVTNCEFQTARTATSRNPTAIRPRILAPDASGTVLALDDGRMPVMSVQGSRLSYADLERMPDDGKRYEIFDGEAVIAVAHFRSRTKDVLRLWLRSALHANLQDVSSKNRLVDVRPRGRS